MVAIRSGSDESGRDCQFHLGVADLIRDTFKRGKYQDVILPLIVLRRLDCVLAPTRKGAEAPDRAPRQGPPGPRCAASQSVRLRLLQHTSRYDFERLLADAPHVAANLRNYIAGFSPNMREVLEKFDFDNTISKLAEAGLLSQMLERFKNGDLHPDQVDNPTMGVIFEELIRKFDEALNENPTPVPSENFVRRDSRKKENRRIIDRDAGAPPFDRSSGLRPLQVAVAPAAPRLSCGSSSSGASCFVAIGLEIGGKTLANQLPGFIVIERLVCGESFLTNRADVISRSTADHIDRYSGRSGYFVLVCWSEADGAQ